jgi:hypothetical protein
MALCACWLGRYLGLQFFQVRQRAALFFFEATQAYSLSAFFLLRARWNSGLSSNALPGLSLLVAEGPGRFVAARKESQFPASGGTFDRQ